MSRRLISIALMACLTSWPAAAVEPLIGVMAPLSGPAEILGRQIAAGASFAGQATATQLFVADDQCTAQGAARAARQMIERKVVAVIGFLCTEAIEAALPLLSEAKTPVISIGVRTDSLTDRRSKTGWQIVRLAPRADGEATALSQALVSLWRRELFAIVDDGTINGREIAEAFRLAAEQAALKPVFVDTYRPDLDNQVGLIGRLRKAGATHVLVGGSAHDIAVMSRDAMTAGVDLQFAGGENLRTDATDIALAAGTLMIGLPEWSDVADRQVVDELRKRRINVEGYFLPAYAAVQIAAAASQAQTGGADLFSGLASHRFDTAIGSIAFDAKGDLMATPYRLFRYDGQRFVPLETN